jgi:two-component system heavy metal sensor histidine kinase CusS
MKLKLRTKFMLWLMAHTSANYLALGFGLYLFNQHELREHPDDIEEEKEELLIIYGIMIGVLPIAFVGAWLVTGQVLRPLQAMLRTADQIRAGQIEQRLEAPVASDELGHLARTLNDAFDNYHRLLGRVDRFSLDAAHQLRNPLAAMRTAAEVCLQQPRSPAEYEETLVRLLDESRRLGHTVDQLLLLARLTRDLPQEIFEPMDLTALVRDLTENLRPAFDERDLRLEVQLPVMHVRLLGSPRLLEQAVANLLDNALRITPCGGQVRVELAPPANGRLALSVADSGPGFPSQLTPGFPSPDSAFAPTTTKEGTGLGLLIVSNIVRAHAGTVQASVSEWNGARFTLELPALA